MLKNLLCLILLSLIISGCADGGFLTSEKEPHAGKREAIFIDDAFMNQTKHSGVIKAADIKKPISLASWPHSHNFQAEGVQNIKYQDQFELSKQVNISWNKENNSLQPVIYNGFVFVFHSGVLSKYNLETLDNIWSNDKISYAESIGGSLSVDTQYLLLADGTNKIRCFSVENGELLWVYEAANAIRARPFIKGGIVYFIAIDNAIYAVNLKSGTHKWVVLSSAQNVINSPVGNSVTGLGDMLIASHTNGYIYFLDINNGEKVTEIAPSFSGDYLSHVASGFNQPLITMNNNLYFIDERHQMTIVNSSTGEFKISTSVPRAKYFWVNGDYTYILSSNNVIWALNNENGKIIWHTNLDVRNGDMLYAPMIINSKLMIFSKMGLVYIYNLTNGEQIDILSLGNTVLSAPIISSDKIVTITGGGKLSVWN